MNNTSLVFKKGITFIIGLFVMAYGVALSVKANLGVSPISCVPYVYSLKYPLTLGQTTIILNVLLILLQMVLLGKKYKLFQLIQFPVVFLFGFFIDFTLETISWMTPSHYFWQAFICLFGCIVLAFGVFLEVKAKLTYLPGEGLAMAITETFKVEFGKAKIGTDSSLVVIGIVSSFILMGKLLGIREGTIVAAILVGYLVKFFNRKINLLDILLADSAYADRKTRLAPKVIGANKKLVISISREYGSGGLEIGQEVARQLGVNFYDKELIKLTAENSGFTAPYIQQHEQKLAHTLLYHLYEQNYAYINERKPPLNALFLVQSKIIRDIYEKEACVIIGRCANFILKDSPGCFNIFIHADKEYRKGRISRDYNVDSNLAEKELEKTDRDRANYCKQFTGNTWGDVNNYHLAINSSALGVSQSARLIVEAVKSFMASS